MSGHPIPIKSRDKTSVCEHHFEYKGDIDLSRMQPGWGDGYQSEKNIQEKYQCPICHMIEYRKKQ